MDSCRLNTTILPSANKSAGGKIIYEETVTNSVQTKDMIDILLD